MALLLLVLLLAPWPALASPAAPADGLQYRGPRPGGAGRPPAGLPTPLPTASADEVFCDFGPLPVQSLCEWRDGCGALAWAAGTGLAANWLGGPATDSTAGSMEGGYAFLECSQTVPPGLARGQPASQGGLLHSPQLGSTGVLGTCLLFKYAIDGLSPAGLRLLLHVGYDESSSTAARALNETAPVAQDCDRPNAALQEERAVLWQADYHGAGAWQQAQLLYAYPDLHSLIFEGLPVEAGDPSRSYRGYIAVDDIDLQPGASCVGFCNFAGGFCDWTNEPEDDFDWSISRGSGNPTTGPVADRGAAAGSPGGYVFIDSSFPRRPGDVARLASVSLPASAPDAPMCLRFSFHMFGPGVGELRLSVRHARALEAQLQELWRLRGNAGNAWFDSRVTVSSPDDFQLVFEASVGNTAMGDIAIDDVSFSTGACPTSPQVAAPAHLPRDCTFEVDECGWLNGREPAVQIGGAPAPAAGTGSGTRGQAIWERVSQQTLSPRNQRKPYSLPAARPRQEFFMALQGRAAAAAGGASLTSGEVRSSGEPLCLTFWYLMFESFIDATGPSLGVLRVLVQPVAESAEAAVPVWQLYNNQGPSWNYGQANIAPAKGAYAVVFEGTWGPNRASGSIAVDDLAFYSGNCSVRPNSATVRPEDCSFERGLCGWENVTGGGISDPRVQWQRAFPSHRPAQLLDKTFGSPGDFVFFDIFSPNQRRQVRLRSPVVGPAPAEQEATCFSFWFVAFGVEESTSLRVIRAPAGQDSSQEQDSEQVLLWSLNAKGFNNPRPSWAWAQVTIELGGLYRLVLEGSASNGGFAIDDIRFLPQACPTRPSSAKPSSQEL